MTTNATKAAGFGLVVFALSLAQFIITVDTTIMNVAVPTLVEDLNTTVSAIQGTITLFALVMASFMLIGSKLGELYGRKKMFQIGLVIYGIGSVITSIAPSVGVLIFGWSILEGIGASLMMPAMMALISFNFKGKQRVSALGIIAGVAGAAAALGPIIGGALATYASWRYAFVAEAVIAAITLVMSRAIMDAPSTAKSKLDYKGAALAASGLGLFVLGILQASEYGWIRAVKPLTIGDVSFDFFGLSVVPILASVGALLIWLFFRYEKKQIDAKKPYLLDVRLLSSIPLRSGLTVVLVIQLVLAGSLFVMPLFLQLVLDYSAITSGIALLPISVGLIGMSIFGSKLLSRRFNEIDSVRIGQGGIIVGLVWLAVIISNDTTVTDLIGPFLVLGAGIGLVIPLIQSIVLGSVPTKQSSQAAGLNYTYQQLGTSLGTAVIGSILLFSLGNGIVDGLASSSLFDQQAITKNSTAISSNVEFVSNFQLESQLAQSDLSSDQQRAILAVNDDARIRALRVAIGTAAVIALVSIVASGRIKDAVAMSQKNNVEPTV